MYVGLELRKRARIDPSVCFRPHGEKHIDRADKARGLWIRVSSQLKKLNRPGSVEKMRQLLIQLQSVHLDVDMMLAHRCN